MARGERHVGGECSWLASHSVHVGEAHDHRPESHIHVQGDGGAFGRLAQAGGRGRDHGRSTGPRVP